MGVQVFQPYFDTLSQGVQIAGSLRQAAMQQQQLQQAHDEFQQQQALKQQEFQANQQQSLAARLAAGYKPIDASGNVNVAAPVAQSSLTPSPSASPFAPQPGGAAPLPTGANSMTPSLNFGTGATANVAADPGRGSVSIGGQQLQVPTQAEQTQNAVNRQTALEQADRIPINDKLADAIGLPHGTKVPPEHLGGFGMLAHWMNPPQQDNTPGPWKSETTADKNGNLQSIVTNTDGTTKVTPVLDQNKQPVNVGAPGVSGAAPKNLTPDAQMAGANQAMKSFHSFEAEEMTLRQQLDRIDTALKTNGAYTLKTDDKGNSSLSKVNQDTDPDPTAIMQDLQTQRANVGARLQQVLTNKYDAGDQYSQMTTGKPSAWGMSKQRALADLQQRMRGGQPQPGQAPAQPQGPAQPAAPQTRPAATSARQPKVASIANVQAYAKAKGIPLGQAQQEFKQADYAVQ